MEEKILSNVNQDEKEVHVSESNPSIAKVEDTKKEKSKEKLFEEIEIPEGVEFRIKDDVLIAKKDDKELKRKFVTLIDVKIEGNKVVISSKRTRKIERKLFGTIKAHVRNMIKGLQEGFTYKLQIANVHFPMNVSHDKDKNELVVKNFLGEKHDRRIKLVQEVDVKIDNEVIELTGFDIEKVGQTATNIEKGTRIRNKDRRIYQDGIFIFEKPGRVYA